MRFTAPFLFFISLLSFFKASGQQTDVAILQNQLKNSQGKAKVNLLIDLVHQLKTTDSERAKDYADEAYDLSKKLKYSVGMIESTLYYGIYWRDEGRFRKAVREMTPGIEAARKSNNQQLELYGLRILKTIYQVWGKETELKETDLAYKKLEHNIDLEKRSKKLDEVKGLYRQSEERNERIISENKDLEQKLEQTVEEKLREEKELERIAKEKAEYELKVLQLENITTKNALKLSEQEKEILEYNSQLKRQHHQKVILLIALAALVVFLGLVWQNLRIKKRANEERIISQQQLMVQEKMATLGQLTAGIAHEIKNPLNFVNNFAEGSTDIAQELEEVILEQQPNLESEQFQLLQELSTDLKQNAIDIQTNGKRIDRIVQSMMNHARGDKGQKQDVDINILIAENLNLAYHGFKSNYPDFHINLAEHYDPKMKMLQGVPQDLNRVFINILNNACYTLHQKNKASKNGFEPQLTVRTEFKAKEVIVSIKDNGQGIPNKVREKIFTPFYTTKPTGEGNTGLGLSISYDIVVQGHHGKIDVESKEGEFSEFIISLPA